VVDVVIVNADVFVDEFGVRAGGAAAGVLFHHDTGETDLADFEEADFDVAAGAGDLDPTDASAVNGAAGASNLDAVAEGRVVVAAQLDEFAIIQINRRAPRGVGIAGNLVADRGALGRVVDVGDDDGKISGAGPAV